VNANTRRSARVSVLVLLVAAPAGIARLTQAAPAKIAAPARTMSCGFDRWPVKTLADRHARRVNFHPRATTVPALRLLRPTSSYGRGRGVERTTYRIRVRLVETTLEADEDYHLVVADRRHPGQTMIVEFPAQSCTKGALALRRRGMAKARSAFVRACGYPSSGSFHFLRGTATVIGVGFFDFNHGQTGVAPNAIELHPVVGFSMKVSC
jgi:hypothetical protein